MREIVKEELKNKEGIFTILNEENSLFLIQSILEEYIDKGNISFDKKKRGEVIFLEAPTGSGKDSIFEQLVKQNPEKKYIELNMDMFRNFYSLFIADLEVLNDRDYVKLTNQFTYEIFIILQEILIKYFPSTNIVISGSLRETDWNEELMREYKEHNYIVKLITVTVPKKEGLYSIIKRYLEIVDSNREKTSFHKGTARYTSLDYFRETNDKFLQNFTYFVMLYYDNPGKIIDVVEVYRRNKSLKDFNDDNLMYSSEINRNENPINTIIELRNKDFQLEQQDIDRLLELVDKNREYLIEQDTMTEILDTISSLAQKENVLNYRKTK